MIWKTGGLLEVDWKLKFEPVRDLDIRSSGAKGQTRPRKHMMVSDYSRTYVIENDTRGGPIELCLMS
jgi:hypothetical protein